MSIEELRDQYTREADGTVGINRGYAFSTYNNHPSGHRITLIDHYSNDYNKHDNKHRQQ